MAFKLNCIVLSVGDKMKIIKLFKEGESGKNVTEKYDVGISTISDIKKNSE
jgi:transposase